MAGESKQSESANLATKGTVVAFLTGISRVSGLIRDVLFSFFFGASPIADAFFLAFRIPNFFRRLVAEGAFQQAFVPILTLYQTEKSDQELTRFVRAVAGNFMLALTVLCVLGVVGAPQLVQLFTLNNWVFDERNEAAVWLTRIMFPYLGFVAFSSFYGAILNSRQRFAIPAAAPILLNLSMIFAMVVGSILFINGIYMLAWAVVVAGALQLLLHLPSTYRCGYLQVPRISWKDPGVVRVVKLIAPAVYAASAGQVNILVGTILASQLVVGTVSWLYYADRLIELPIGLIAIALQTVLLPNLSRLWVENRHDVFEQTLSWGLKVGLIFGLPASSALFFIAEPLVAGIYMRGEFKPADLHMTAAALQVFAVGVAPLVLTRVLAPAFFAREDTKTPFKYATVGVLTNIVLSVLLYRHIGLVGIAYATSVAAYINSYLLLRRLINDRIYRVPSEVLHTGLRSAVATAAMVVFLLLLKASSYEFGINGWWGHVSWLFAFVFGGLIVYLCCLWLAGMRPKHLIHRV